MNKKFKIYFYTEHDPETEPPLRVKSDYEVINYARHLLTKATAVHTGQMLLVDAIRWVVKKELLYQPQDIEIYLKNSQGKFEFVGAFDRRLKCHAFWNKVPYVNCQIATDLI